jgi:medium-chain acyl-[acyl-carrier-protein] hydrolase
MARFHLDACGQTKPSPAGIVGLRVFAFPHAGGSASLFAGWQHRMPAGIEIVGVTPPGHGVRLSEPRFRRLLPLVRALTEEIQPLLDRPFAFVGYSMGALVAFEVCRELRRRQAPLPLHLSVYGASAPDFSMLDGGIHDLPDEEFRARLKAFGGMPESVLGNRELMQLVMPILRADFEALGTYEFREEPPLPVAVCAVGASDDRHTTETSIRAWQRHTSVAFRRELMRGDHGFVITQGRHVADGIADVLRPYLGECMDRLINARCRARW